MPENCKTDNKKHIENRGKSFKHNRNSKIFKHWYENSSIFCSCLLCLICFILFSGFTKQKTLINMSRSNMPQLVHLMSAVCMFLCWVSSLSSAKTFGDTEMSKKQTKWKKKYFSSYCFNDQKTSDLMRY